MAIRSSQSIFQSTLKNIHQGCLRPLPKASWQRKLIFAGSFVGVVVSTGIVTGTTLCIASKAMDYGEKYLSSKRPLKNSDFVEPIKENKLERSRKEYKQSALLLTGSALLFSWNIYLTRFFFRQGSQSYQRFRQTSLLCDYARASSKIMFWGGISTLSLYNNFNDMTRIVPAAFANFQDKKLKFRQIASKSNQSFEKE